MSNPTEAQRAEARSEGFEFKLNPETGKQEWFWAPSIGVRFEEIMHYLMTFEDPWARFRRPVPDYMPVYGRDYI